LIDQCRAVVNFYPGITGLNARPAAGHREGTVTLNRANVEIIEGRRGRPGLDNIKMPLNIGRLAGL